MQKIIGLIAAVAMVGVAGMASAADAPGADSKKAVELTANEMDGVTAGLGFGSSSKTTSAQIKAGGLKLIFNGTTWTRVPG